MTLRWLISFKAAAITLLACAGSAAQPLVASGPLSDGRGSVAHLSDPRDLLSRDRQEAVWTRDFFTVSDARGSLAQPGFQGAVQPGLASVTGQVELADSREASVRNAKNYAGVVAWLEPVRRAAPLPKPEIYTITQKGKRFTPHILPIPVGATVDFPNFDPIFHNAFSNFAGQPFDTGLYRPGTTQKVQFRREGIVRVFCNIHSNMSAVILVLDTPYYTMSKADGTFRIEGVPNGEYTLHVWHERATQDSLAALARKITIADAHYGLPMIRISESGYLEIPHKNKHGREYPPARVEHSVYPGGRK